MEKGRREKKKGDEEKAYSIEVAIAKVRKATFE
jgi:hypothetical protein